MAKGFEAIEACLLNLSAVNHVSISHDMLNKLDVARCKKHGTGSKFCVYHTLNVFLIGK